MINKLSGDRFTSLTTLYTAGAGSIMQYIKYSSCLKVSDKNWVWGITDSAESIFFRKCATSLFSVKKHHKTNYFNIKILPSPLFPFAESEKEEQKERKKERGETVHQHHPVLFLA